MTQSYFQWIVTLGFLVFLNWLILRCKPQWLTRLMESTNMHSLERVEPSAGSEEKDTSEKDTSEVAETALWPD